jgi:alkylation response protein AidB-like acyl-CoA dehydrogenase
VDQWKLDHGVPWEIWRKIGRKGFLCTSMSKSYSDLGGDFLYSVVVLETLTKTNLTGLIAHLHKDVVVSYIDTFGTIEQKENSSGKNSLKGVVTSEVTGKFTKKDD